MKTKKTVTPFNMQEIARALREIDSEDSPNAFVGFVVRNS